MHMAVIDTINYQRLILSCKLGEVNLLLFCNVTCVGAINKICKINKFVNYHFLLFVVRYDPFR